MGSAANQSVLEHWSVGFSVSVVYDSGGGDSNICPHELTGGYQSC